MCPYRCRRNRGWLEGIISRTRPSQENVVVGWLFHRQTLIRVFEDLVDIDPGWQVKNVQGRIERWWSCWSLAYRRPTYFLSTQVSCTHRNSRWSPEEPIFVAANVRSWCGLYQPQLVSRRSCRARFGTQGRFSELAFFTTIETTLYTVRNQQAMLVRLALLAVRFTKTLEFTLTRPVQKENAR